MRNTQVSRYVSSDLHGMDGTAASPWSTRASRGLYSASQTAIHTPPIAAVITKAMRHPYCSVSHGTKSGVRIAPAFEPELNSPIAKARSFFSNHSDTVFTAAGKFPASPKPRAARAIPNPSAEGAIPCAAAAALHNATEKT